MSLWVPSRSSTEKIVFFTINWVVKCAATTNVLWKFFHNADVDDTQMSVAVKFARSCAPRDFHLHGALWLLIIVRYTNTLTYLLTSYGISKNDTGVAHHNFDAHKPILTIFHRTEQPQVRDRTEYDPKLSRNASHLSSTVWDICACCTILFCIPPLMVNKNEYCTKLTEPNKPWTFNDLIANSGWFQTPITNEPGCQITYATRYVFRIISDGSNTLSELNKN